MKFGSPSAPSETLMALNAASARKASWIEAGQWMKEEPNAEEVDAAVQWVEGHDDHLAYHALGWVRQHAVARYAEISAGRKVSILVDALRTQVFLNDFGLLDVSESSLRAAGKAVVELGEVALPALKGMLGDGAAAPLMGSEEATLSSLYGYRRKDFAYFLMCGIEGKEYVFEAGVRERDVRMEGG